MTNADIRGRFVWYELMTTDPEAAKSFYTRLIGWGTQAWEGSPRPYTMWTNGGNPLGGVMELPSEARQAGAPPHWLAYIATPNVDETVKKATAGGGRVLVPPTDIPMVGRFSVLTDPQGAMFAAFTPASEPPGHEGPAGNGEFSWHELATTDVPGALAFYQAVFGWEKQEAHDMGPMGVYQIYGRKGAPLGGIFKKPAEMPAPPHFQLYVHVADVRPLAGKVKELGGQVLNGPMEVPGGDWIVNCMDPQGASFSLHSSAGK